MYKFPDTIDFSLQLVFDSCEKEKCLDFNDFNIPGTYKQMNFTLVDTDELDSRLMIDETMGEVEIFKGMHIIFAN